MNRRLRASWSSPYLEATLTDSARAMGPDMEELATVEGRLWGARRSGELLVEEGSPEDRSFRKIILNRPPEEDDTGPPRIASLARIEIDGSTRVLALSSGRTAAERHCALLSSEGAVLGCQRLESFFEHLAVRWDIVGTELNLESAAGLQGTLRLFQRGNGAERAGRRGHNTTLDIPIPDWLSHVQAVFESPETPFDPEIIRDLSAYDLGELQGTRLTFSGAAELSPEWLVYAASAERCEDVQSPGTTAGAVLGLMALDGRAFQAHLLDDEGQPVAAKVEGLAVTESTGGAVKLLLSVDTERSSLSQPLMNASLTGNLVEKILEEILTGNPAFPAGRPWP